MSSLYYIYGKQAALDSLGLPSDSLILSNGQSGRLQLPSHIDPRWDAASAFSEQQRQTDIADTDQSLQQPVGSGQSTDKTSSRKLHGKRTFRGLEISIENRAGSVRHWYDPHNEEEGETKIKYPYGYINLTEGMDGDHLDCYLGPDEEAPYVYVVTTNKAPDFKEVDEQKCFLGFDSEEDAKKAFYAQYDDKRFFRSIKAMKFEEFKEKALRTREAKSKKVGSANFTDKVPGDCLNLPTGSTLGQKSILGNQEDGQSKIERTFSYIDNASDSCIVDTANDAVPSGPTI